MKQCISVSEPLFELWGHGLCPAQIFYSASKAEFYTLTPPVKITRGVGKISEAIIYAPV